MYAATVQPQFYNPLPQTLIHHLSFEAFLVRKGKRERSQY